jgi:lipoprotein-anchoring transpeptidase ErfK/SrfK
MINQDVMNLYETVEIGAKVVVTGPGMALNEALPTG